MDKEKFLDILKKQLSRSGCKDNDFERLYTKLSSQLPDVIKNETDVNDLVIQTLTAECHRHKNYDSIAVQFLSNIHRKNSPDSFVHVAERLQTNRDVMGNLKPLLSAEFYDFIQNHKEEIDKVFHGVIDLSQHFRVTTFGWKTLYRSYLMRTHEGVIEQPDHMWFRVSLFLYRDNWKKVATVFQMLREGCCIHATPTLYSAGMPHSQMASCFTEDTRVLTMNGYKRIVDVEFGEQVLTHAYRWKPVIQKHENERAGRQMYRLVFHQKPEIKATLDHPFLVYDRVKKGYIWKHVSDMKVGDWVAEGEQVSDYFLDRHQVHGILYAYRENQNTSECQTVLYREEKLQKLLEVLHMFKISYTFDESGGIILKNISSWLPVHIHDYLQFGYKAFSHFLKGIRFTSRYDPRDKSYIFSACQSRDLTEIATVKGFQVKWLPNGRVRFIKPLFKCDTWLGWRRIIGDRQAVKLLKKTLLRDAPTTVYTLGVHDDHSYVAEGVIVKNCFLVGSEDSVKGIYETLSDCAQISKWAGGLGIHISSVRGKNSYIYGTNGTSNGILPMLKVFNDTARYIDQCFTGDTRVYTERGQCALEDIQPFCDKVLTKKGTFERVLKKLVYCIPTTDLVKISVQTPVGTRETVVMSKHHTVEWRDNKGLLHMTAFVDAGYGWKTVFHPLSDASLERTAFSEEECFVLGYMYRNMRRTNVHGPGLVYTMHVPDEHLERIVNFMQTCGHDNYSFAENVLIVRVRGSHLPCKIDFSKLGSFPNHFARLEPLSKTLEFKAGWDIANTDDHHNITNNNDVWVDYRSKIRGLGYGRVVSVDAYDGPDVLVYDLEVENDPSYQTSIGMVHNGGGKRNGAFAMYLEPWHSDILDFLEAKRNVGSDEERARDLFYGLWVPDLFMKHVSEGRDWHLMSPQQSPGLNKVWGKDFEKLYHQYIKEGKFVRKVPARDVWKEIMRSQIETGTPYMLYKDTCNRRSNQQNLGTIRSSNLCCEIIEYSDENEYAVCNLASISLPSCLVVPSFNEHLWVYGKEDCVYCLLLKGLLDERGISYTYHDATSKKELTEDEAARVVKGRTLPIVYVNGEYVGGFQEMWNVYLKPSFDFERLGKITGQLVENLNIIIDKNAYPIDKCKISNEKHRPIGIGVQGLADVFFEMLTPYDSTDARELNARIFECMYYYALDKSNELAVRDGVYSSFNGSPLSKGIFHFEMTKNIVPVHYQWEDLRSKIIEHGVRNSLLIAPMPTASTSQILGNTESFEPLTSNLYLRRDDPGEFYVYNKVLRKILEWMGMWTNETIDHLIVYKGSIKNMTVPLFLKNVFRTIWEIPQKALIDMASDRQHFIDQSQSFNIYLQDPDMEKLTKIHFYGWKKGLKTGSYYVRSRSSISSSNVTVDPSKEKPCDSCSA